MYALKNNKGYESISVSYLVVSGYHTLGSLSHSNYKSHSNN